MRLLKLSFLVLCALLFAAQANALSIWVGETKYQYESWGDLGDRYWTGNETSQSEIDVIISPIISPAEELYKSDAEGWKNGVFTPQTESGPLAGSYETTFTPSSDPNNALIEWVEGTPIVGAPAYALVKDGNATPAWYLFDLTSFGWNGMEDLLFEGFWEGSSGAISHVALYGTSTPVPEPATMLLLGSGLVGLAGLRRKFKKN